MHEESKGYIIYCNREISYPLGAPENYNNVRTEVSGVNATNPAGTGEIESSDRRASLTMVRFLPDVPDDETSEVNVVA